MNTPSTAAIAGKAIAVWLCILALAVANGLFRETVLLPLVGTFAGFILSGLLLSALILATAYVALPWFGNTTIATCVAVGLGWLLLTLAFEFSFGRMVQGKSWPELLAAYTFREGNLWPVVLLVTAAAPYLAARLRGLLR
jgi:hypothetical protein